MNVYPHSAPIILTDDIFVSNGGSTGTSTAAQRNAAYYIAESDISYDISTLLLPTVVTGTYTWNEYNPYLLTDWAYVNNVSVIRFIDTEESIYHTISGTANVNVSLRDDTYGIIDIHNAWRNCNCASSSRPYPYHIQVVYEAGLPTGVANRPDVLLALSTLADIVLGEIIGYGNETPGLVGVQQFKNQDYTELRTKLKETGYGSSPRAQFVSRLLANYRKYRYVKLGW